MITKQAHFIYFSPTGTTKKVLDKMNDVMAIESVVHDFTPFHAKYKEIHFESQNVLVIGFPVYSGRVPATFAERISFIKGNNTPAIIVAAYGNRDYDDALIEMKSLLIKQGIIPVAAAAFVTEHNMYSKIATGRPDKNDLHEIAEFASDAIDLIKSMADAEHCDLYVKGNRNYRDYLIMPMQPHSTELCNRCGSCANLCPAGAIPLDSPQNTNSEICIRCMGCVRLCTLQARKLTEQQMLGAEKHLSGYTKYRKNEIFLCNNQQNKAQL